MNTKEELNKRAAQVSDEEMAIVTGGLDDLDKRELETERTKNANSAASYSSKKAPMDAWNLVF